MKINRILIGLLVLSCIIVVINDLLLVNVPEIFTLGDEIGAILSNLSLAYISSYIFYYVVVVLQEKKDASNINSNIHVLNQRIIQSVRFAYHALAFVATQSKDTFNQYNWNDVTLEMIQEICNKTDPNRLSENFGSQLGRFVGDHETIGELVYRSGVLKVEREINTLFSFMRFLGTDHIRILNNIRNTSFFSSKSEMIGVRGRVGNTDMSSWAKDIYEYIQAIKELEKFDQTYFSNKII